MNRIIYIFILILFIISIIQSVIFTCTDFSSSCCNSIDITFASSITNIPMDALSYCTSIQTITFPTTITSIGY
jgi:hypothetical protein